MAANAHPGLGVPSSLPAERWGIVLAGGEGARMRPLIRQWLGEDRPKQYCSFVGSRSMLQHTIDRAHSIIPEENMVTVIGQDHRRYLTESQSRSLPGLVLEQPKDLGTAPGAFLAIAYVLADNPEASVILFPSDHFVRPEDRFREHLLHAFELVEKFRGQILIAGALPDRADTDCDWIGPGNQSANGGSPFLAHAPKQVVCFHEKPGCMEARSLLRRGCLWDTMIVAARAKTLWTLGRQCLPAMMHEFDAFLAVLRSIRNGQLDPKFEASALAAIYSNLTPADLTKDFLHLNLRQSMVLPMDGVEWCDWGSPQRVTETLTRLGRPPLFRPEHLGLKLKSAIMAKEGCVT